MNTHSLPKALALILCAGLILPIASSCKKNKKDPSDRPSDVVQTDATEENGEPVKAKYVRATDAFYSDKTTELYLPVDENREFIGQAVTQTIFSGDTIVVAYLQGYELTPEEVDEYDHLDLNKQEDISRGYDIQALRNQSGLAFYNMEGEWEATVKTPNQVDIIGIFGSPDGRVGVFTSEFVYDTSAAADQKMKNVIKLTYYSATGAILEEHELSDEAQLLLGSEYVTVIPMGDQGKLLVQASSEIVITDAAGMILAHSECKKDQAAIFESDGRYYVVYSESKIKADETERHTYVEEIDPQTAELKNRTETFTVKDRVSVSDGKCYMAGQRKSICLCDFIGGTVETIVDWGNTNMAPTEYLPEVKSVSGDDIYLLYQTVEGSGQTAVGTPCLTRLHKEADNPYAGKKTIYVASCVEGSEDFDQLLAAYNRRPESKARVIAYVEEADISMDYQKQISTAADQMLLNMKSGNGPDILLNCSAFGQFNSKDVLIDLNPYMDGPNGIDRSKYFDNIFRAFEVDGKLYQMPLNVDMRGLVGNPDLLGQIDSWTIDEFDKKLNTLGTQTLPLLGWDPELRNYDVSEQMGFLLELLFHDMNHYVDYSNYTTNFDSDDFRRLLEISKKYGGRVNFDTMQQLYEEYDDMFHDAQCMMMQDGVCAMRTMYCGGLTSGGFAMYADLCHGNARFLGWPTTSGKGLASQAAISVGISAYSDCPDEAWDFVAFLLSAESQSTLSGSHWGGICIHRESERDGLLLEIEEYRAGKRSSDDPVSEDQIDRFIALIEKIDTSIHTDPTIVEIVAEEAPAFFNGQKSADEVCRIIQDRAGRVVAEMQ